MIEVIAFLGNYGMEYARTRHNVAWILSEELNISKNLIWKPKFRGEYAKDSITSNGQPLHFIKPHTYMNASGFSIGDLVSFHKISPSSLLVVHDEVELDLGTISLKVGGGLAGHNGLRSIKEHLGSSEFWRLRIGIGRPAPKSEKNVDMAGYVLSRIPDTELSSILDNLDALNALFSSIKDGDELTALLPKYAKLKPSLPSLISGN